MYLNISKIRYIINKSDLNNLKARQKELQKYQIAETELSVNENARNPQIWILSHFLNIEDSFCLIYKYYWLIQGTDQQKITKIAGNRAFIYMWVLIKF